MKFLLKDRWEGFLVGLLIIGSISLVGTGGIHFVLSKTDSETKIITVFLITFGVLFAMLSITSILSFYKSFRNIKNLCERWNLSFSDVADGIYSYEIQNYWIMNASQFSELLNTARSKDEIDKKNSYA